MPLILPYFVEYSASEEQCNKCKKSIPWDTMQIGIMQQSKANGCTKPEWYDMNCFFEIRRPVSVDLMDGFTNLRYHDQMEIQRKLDVEVNANGSTSGGQPSSNECNIANMALEKEIERQSNDFFTVYDQLKRLEDKNSMDSLEDTLRTNNQLVPKRYAEILNHLSDIICFGALAPCPMCKDGKFVLRGSIYRCTGYYSAWSTCTNSVKEPQRLPVTLPPKLQELFENSLKVRTRILRDAIEFNSVDFELHTKQPLFNMEFCIVGGTKSSRKEIEHKIHAMGGKIALTIHTKLAAVILNADEVENCTRLMKEAAIERIHVVPIDCIDKFIDNNPVEVIVKNDISKWVADPYEVVFNIVDISADKNTFYQLQLLDLGSTSIVFESTGRVDTCIGHSSTQRSYSTLSQAQAVIKKYFIEKTGFFCNKFVDLYNHRDIENETLSKTSLGKPVQPPIFKLDFDCFEELFDWLSLKDLYAFGQTCKRMQQVAGHFFKLTYPGAQVCCSKYRFKSIRCNAIEIDGFIDFIENIKLVKDSVLRSNKRLDHDDRPNLANFDESLKTNWLDIAKSNEFKSLKKICCDEVTFDAEKVEYIKKCLARVEVVELFNCRFEVDFYDGFLQYCKNMKRLHVINRDAGDYNWLLQHYPSLEQLVLSEWDRIHTRELTTFFKLNPNVKHFSCREDFISRNRHSFIASDVKLDTLSIQCWNTGYDYFHDIQNEFHERQIYKRLHIYWFSDLLPNNLHQFVPTNTVEKLAFDTLPFDTHALLLPFVNLKELYSHAIPRSLDMEAVANALVNIERVHFKRAYSNQIIAFIRCSRKLSHIAVENIDGMKKNALELWNKERGKLANARKVVVYINEKKFLKIKKARKNKEYRIVEVKRYDSHCWTHDSLGLE